MEKDHVVGMWMVSFVAVVAIVGFIGIYANQYRGQYGNTVISSGCDPATGAGCNPRNIAGRATMFENEYTDPAEGGSIPTRPSKPGQTPIKIGPGGGCTPSIEICNGRDDNCNGRIDDSCTTCGDGQYNSSMEECEPGFPVQNGYCSQRCMVQCNLGYVYDESTHQCRPQNGTYCADGAVQWPNSVGQYEDCDDGMLLNGDGCSDQCKWCGDGTYNPAHEECEPGFPVQNGYCEQGCMVYCYYGYKYNENTHQCS